MATRTRVAMLLRVSTKHAHEYLGMAPTVPYFNLFFCAASAAA